MVFQTVDLDSETSTREKKYEDMILNKPFIGEKKEWRRKERRRKRWWRKKGRERRGKNEVEDKVKKKDEGNKEE